MKAAGAVPGVDQFLATARRSFLFCRSGDGSPTGYAMHVTHQQERVLYFTTYRKSPKVARLRSADRVACIVMEERDGRLGWVSGEASATLMEPSPVEVDELLGGFTSDPRVSDDVMAKVRSRLLEGKRIVIRIDFADPDDLVVQTSPA